MKRYTIYIFILFAIIFALINLLSFFTSNMLLLDSTPVIIDSKLKQGNLIDLASNKALLVPENVKPRTTLEQQLQLASNRYAYLFCTTTLKMYIHPVPNQTSITQCDAFISSSCFCFTCRARLCARTKCSCSTLHMCQKVLVNLLSYPVESLH